MTASSPFPEPTAPNHSKAQTATQPLIATDATESAQVVVSLLTRQRTLYEQLRDLGQTQGRLISGQSPEPLLAVLGQRQKLVDELAQINREMEPFRSRWQQLYSGLSDVDRQRVGRLVGEVEALLAGIIEQDDRDREQLEQAKRLIGDELGQVTRSGVAIHAYKVQSAGRGGHRLTDRKG